MIPDDEMLMAYADGQLDPIAAKRVERAIQENPALVDQVATHRRLSASLAAAFAPIVQEPVPESLRSAAKVAVLPAARKSQLRAVQAAAIAASLAIGVVIGTEWRSAAPVITRGGVLAASGPLAEALDRQLAGDAGEARMLVSFRAADGSLCRVFTAPAIDGIACRNGGAWKLTQTRAGPASGTTEYRQASSAGAPLLAEAQEMMVGEPLNRQNEAQARAGGWR